MKKIDAIALRRVVVEIQAELNKLEALEREWEGHRYGDWTDTFFLRGKSSIFHDFYCGAENIFKKIASELNGGLPSGAGWHAMLLHHMQLEIPQVRPAVITSETGKRLKSFLDFRHKFRHIYGFDLDFEKLEELEQLYPAAQKALVAETNHFLLFLHRLIGELESQE
ncbi:MAG: hypothetical protein AAB354_15100 [candidate division KSB1 bacterium]